MTDANMKQCGFGKRRSMKISATIKPLSIGTKIDCARNFARIIVLWSEPGWSSMRAWLRNLICSV
jgi:hypothetical protein